MTTDRRTVLAGGAAMLAAACVPLEPGPTGRVAARLRIIEAAANGVLGVSFLDPASGAASGYGDFALFPHCSSFKLSLAALVMQLGEQGTLDPGRRVRWSKADLLAYAPFTTARLNEGATLLELAKAAQQLSDNTAANLLLAEVGGPEGLTRFWRALGDETSRLDRIEPALNDVPPGEVRDTTTPAAMARTIGKLLYGEVLGEANRALLKDWMVATTTGLDRVRAGLPPSWRAGDKTGTTFGPGMGAVYVDIGFVEPVVQDGLARPPMVYAAYFRTAQPQQQTDPAALAVLAAVGSVLADVAGN